MKNSLLLVFLFMGAGLFAQTKISFEKKATWEEVLAKAKEENKLIFVDVYATWCGPCKMIGPILEELSDEMSSQVTIAKHNIDNEPNTPTKYGVRGIPTMLLFKDGELKATKVGATTKSDLKSWIEQNI